MYLTNAHYRQLLRSLDHSGDGIVTVEEVAHYVEAFSASQEALV